MPLVPKLASVEFMRIAWLTRKLRLPMQGTRYLKTTGSNARL